MIALSLVLAGMTAASTSTCDTVYALRGLDPEAVALWRRPELEVASQLRAAVRNGCAAEVLALARAPERYEARARITLGSHARVVLQSGLIAALAEVSGKDAEAALVDRLMDTAVPLRVRIRAAESLGRAGVPKLVALLDEVAKDGSREPSLRAAAIRGLGRTESLDALWRVEALSRKSPDERIQIAAINAFGSLAIRATASETKLRRAAVDALVKRLDSPYRPWAMENLRAAQRPL